jgi:hypothetical protein
LVRASTIWPLPSRYPQRAWGRGGVVALILLPETISPTGLGQGVGHLAHALHPASDNDPGLTMADHGQAQAGRLEGRGAGGVDGHGGDAVGKPSLEGGLASRHLAQGNGSHAVAQDHATDGFPFDSSSQYCFSYGRRAQLYSRQVLEDSAEAAKGGASGSGDEDFPHALSLPRSDRYDSTFPLDKQTGRWSPCPSTRLVFTNG